MRVVVADDTLLLRAGVARLLREAGFDVVAECSTVDDLLLKVQSLSPDVAIIDIRMPPTFSDEGLQAAQQIRSRYGRIGLLLLSQYIELGLAMKLLSDDAEGIGYLLKDRITDLDEFASAVRRVGQGGSAIDPKIVSQLLGRRRPDNPLASLTPREQEVLELLAQGRSNQAIADRLVISLRAAEKHVSSIFEKLELPATTDDHRRVLAVLAFLRS
jgi:DNA-binding NarL/FixJ family response regulator